MQDDAFLLILVAIVAGSLNAVAGGGTFLTFPTLVFVGVPPIHANATSTVALWPGLWASAAAYRRELVRRPRPLVATLAATSAAGGLVGAGLLLLTPERTFMALTPFLLLAATLIFASGPWATDIFARWIPKDLSSSGTSFVSVGVIQFTIAIYGGYFGAGIGILMLATLTLMGLKNVHQMNAVRMLFSMCINGVAVVVFVASGVVVWPAALVMVAGAIAGGYGGAALARRLPSSWIRAFVILTGLGMSGALFLRQ